MQHQRMGLWPDMSINLGSVRHFLLTRTLLMAAMAGLLVLLGSSFILERPLIATPDRTWDIGPVAKVYVTMTEGNYSDVDLNLRYRVVVPYLAGLLPFSATDSLKIVSYLSLFVFYFFVLLTCRKLGLNIYASVGGLLTVFTSGVHLYGYLNPFLTDAFALMVLSVMVFALVSRYFLVFAIFTILGFFVWELTLWLVPAWFLAGDRRKGAILLVMAALVFFIPRWILPSGLGLITQITSQVEVGFWHQPSFLAKTSIVSWGFLWVLAPIGIWLMPKDNFGSLASAFATLLVGALLYAALAVDGFRYFQILAPVFAIACAQLYVVLFKDKAHIFWALILAALVFAQAFDSVPNILFTEGDWFLASETPTLLLLILGVIYGLGTVFVLKELLLQELREKLPQIRIWFRAQPV